MLGKAVLAQHLLEKAWQQTIDDRHNQMTNTSKAVQKPWPWADVYPVALLHIPQLKLKHIVLNNDSGQALAFGPGLTGVVQGENEENNIQLISAHRDTHFSDLQYLNKGEQIMLENREGDTIRYRVTNIFILDTRINSLAVTNKENVLGNSLILITCFPFTGVSASTPFRYIVEAQQSL